MLDLELFKTFVCVVDEGSFTRAAERVHRPQSTVGQQVRKLEELVGHSLLLRGRTGQNISVTEHGKLLIHYARRMALILAGFNRARPQARLETVSGMSTDLKQKLSAGALDIALVKREPDSGPCWVAWPEVLVWYYLSTAYAPTCPNCRRWSWR
ncbi:LysR family transcriptional regulator [Pseudomonas sp. MDT1-16]